MISGTETMRLAANPEAVGVGLRARRQADTAPVPAAANPVGSDPEFLPVVSARDGDGWWTEGREITRPAAGRSVSWSISRLGWARPGKAR